MAPSISKTTKPSFFYKDRQVSIKQKDYQRTLNALKKNLPRDSHISREFRLIARNLEFHFSNHNDINNPQVSKLLDNLDQFTRKHLQQPLARLASISNIDSYIATQVQLAKFKKPLESDGTIIGQKISKPTDRNDSQLDTQSNSKSLLSLRKALISLYPAKADSVRIAQEAGLNTAYIQLSSKAANNWHHILDAADKHNKIEKIIQIAQKEYPEAKGLQFNQIQAAKTSLVAHSEEKRHDNPISNEIAILSRIETDIKARRKVAIKLIARARQNKLGSYLVAAQKAFLRVASFIENDYPTNIEKEIVKGIVVCTSSQEQLIDDLICCLDYPGIYIRQQAAKELGKIGPKANKESISKKLALLLTDSMLVTVEVAIDTINKIKAKEIFIEAIEKMDSHEAGNFLFTYKSKLPYSIWDSNEIVILNAVLAATNNNAVDIRKGAFIWLQEKAVHYEKAQREHILDKLNKQQAYETALIDELMQTIAEMDPSTNGGSGFINLADLNELTKIIAGLSHFAPLAGRKMHVEVTGVEEVVTNISLEGAHRIVAYNILSKLRKYGTLRSGKNAMGEFLSYVLELEDLPIKTKEKLEEIMKKYHLIS